MSLTTKDALLERAVAALEKIKTAMGVINPVGVVQAFAGSTTPDGWLLCDGSAVSRTTYAALFEAIGTTYGSGDGSTTFNVPNLVDKFVEGSATSGTTKAAGLPNITAGVDLRGLNTNGASIFGGETGAFTNASPSDSYQNINTGTTAGTNYTKRLKLDASRSSSIYGNSTTVQPPALTMRYIIKC